MTEHLPPNRKLCQMPRPTCYFPGVQILLVSYDLLGDERSRDDERLLAAIRRYPCCRLMGSVWLIRTDRSAAGILNSLWSRMEPSDRLLVTDVTNDVMSWRGLNRDVARWIVMNNPAG